MVATSKAVAGTLQQHRLRSKKPPKIQTIADKHRQLLKAVSELLETGVEDGSDVVVSVGVEQYRKVRNITHANTGKWFGAHIPG